MDIKNIFIALLTALFFSNLSAQTSLEDKKKEINKIKKSNSYIYAEATMVDKQDALDLATDILYQNINEWVAKQKKFAGAEKVVTVNTNYAVEDMALPRGNMYRVFMYVKKSEIIPVENASVTEMPEVNMKSDVVPIDAVTSQLLNVRDTDQLSVLLKRLKQEGKITAFNKLSMLQNPDECVMVIFNGNKEVKAVLSAGTNRRNLRTGASDAISNYKGCGAIGVKIK